MNDRGSHKDRHACIGEGKIGLDAMRRVATHPLLSDKPFILETPNDDEGYRREIALFPEVEGVDKNPEKTLLFRSVCVILQIT